MLLYHGTNKKRLEVLKPSYGRFGTGVYLSKDIEYSFRYGKLVALVDYQKTIRRIEYESLIKYAPNLNIEEEEGLTNIRDFIEDEAIEIVYKDGTSEVVIYTEMQVIRYIEPGRKVPKYIVNAVDNMSKYYNLHAKNLEILLEWGRKEDVLDREDGIWLYKFSGEVLGEVAFIEEGDYTGDEFKKYMEE